MQLISIKVVSLSFSLCLHKNGSEKYRKKFMIDYFVRSLLASWNNFLTWGQHE